MIISKKHKYIYLACPKTGTTSIQRFLLEQDSTAFRNKIVIDDKCVCNSHTGHLPMISSFQDKFSVSHQVCHKCNSEDIKKINGVDACDLDGLMLLE